VPEGQSKDRCLVASLNLSLERLDGESRELVRRLGVFQGGAFENDLLAITEFTTEQWPQWRRQLESEGLLRVESLEYLGVTVPFLKFHPTLARVVWASLGEPEQEELKRRHRERYYAVSGWLHFEDRKNPYAVRAIVQRELPNLLVAVRGALDAGEEWAVNFVDSVNKFLGYLGMNGDRADLTQRAEKAAQSVVVGSQAWYLAQINVGERLRQSGQPQQAIGIFQEILVGLGETVSYERGITIIKQARCWRAIGQSAQAAMLCGQALAELGQLEPSDGVKRQMGAAHTELANVLMEMGDYGAARQAYEASLAIVEKLDDKRSVGAVNGQLGTLAMLEGNIEEAAERQQSALSIFNTLDEPEMESVAWHQLGMVYEKAKAWEQAEQAYRASAQLKEAQGNLTDAARTWNQLAIVCALSGKLKDAEAWFRKAIAADNNPSMLAPRLSNLANLLKTQGNLLEARTLAEEALTLKQTLDPDATEIWTTYNILAKITTHQGEAAKAQDYSRQSRQSYAAFAGSRHMLKQNEGFIQDAVEAMNDVKVRPQVEGASSEVPALAKVIQRIWAGVRDEDELCDELGYEEVLIVGEILRRL
jgi:tetratricopeptide (TPR) repeat protein